MEKFQKKRSSLRFRAAMWLNSELVTQRPEIVGLKNLEKIPKRINPIFAGSHVRSDASIQIIARELAGKLNIGIAIQAGNRRSPLINTLLTLVGQDNFYDIDNTTGIKKVNGKTEKIHKYKINLDNYEVMKKAMEKGKTMLVAAHYAPIYDGILPKKPGFAVIYLAHLSGQRVVVPVALEMQTDNEDTGRIDRLSNIAKNLVMGKRPKSKMTICEPITLDLIDPLSMQLMKKWIAARADQKPSGLSPNEEEIAKEAYRKMREDDGNKVMYALAKALPEKRRGIWRKS